MTFPTINKVNDNRSDAPETHKLTSTPEIT